MLTRRRDSRRAAMAVLLLFGLGVCVQAGPPLPCHQVEGNSGVFITSTAYLANPAEEGRTLGLPSVSGTFAIIGEKDFESFVATENILGRAELGYAIERIGLGEWPDEVRAATGLRVDSQAFLHNFNARYMVIPEGGLDRQWMPAVTVGVHVKWNQSRDDINAQLGGACDALGVDHDLGTELTIVATRTFAKVLPRPLIVSAGLRNGDAIHTGLLGFAGERRTTVEGSVIYFLTNRLLLATEYRQKSDLCQPLTVDGRPLVKPEEDWFDVCLGYIAGEHLTIAGGWAYFGNVLNNRENNVWAIQAKYEF